MNDHYQNHPPLQAIDEDTPFAMTSNEERTTRPSKMVTTAGKSLKKLLIPTSLLIACICLSPLLLIQRDVEIIHHKKNTSNSSSKNSRRELSTSSQFSNDDNDMDFSSLSYFNNTIPLPDKQFETGSFSNCTSDMVTSTPLSDYKPIPNHPDASKVIISCREIHFRAPLSQIEKGGVPIVVGVLSGAGGKGPKHRDSIRSTWAKDRKGVYFIVAGKWSDIQVEYDTYRDLIWIDEEEVYEGEESVLPFKTEAFMYIIQTYTLPGKAGFKYLFKTDDDSYVDLAMLEEKIMNSDKGEIHYWGCCTDIYYRPLRHPSRKWMVTFDLYPEEFYPKYCQGAGFAISRQMAQCISHPANLGHFRYNPFEDVSIGLLAERCGYKHTGDCKLIRQYRTKESGELKMLKDGQERNQIMFLPAATMDKRILQHRIKTHADMYAHHKCVTEGCSQF